MEFTPAEKELIVVVLSNSMHDPEQEDIWEDCKALRDRVVKDWGLQHLVVEIQTAHVYE